MERGGIGAGSADAAGERAGGAQVERSARLWLRAYPRRWRAAFGADLVGILVEMGPPGARRVPAREAAAILRAGWALRLREHPPLLRWLGYRFLDLRLPLRYQHWVVDDVLGRLWGARFMVSAWVVWAAIGLNMLIVGDTEALSGYIAFVAVLSVGFSLLLTGPFGRSKRRDAWRRHVSPEVPWSLLARRDRARVLGSGAGADRAG